MKVLHVVNWHRGGGGSDNACRATIDISRRRGIDVDTFERDSRDLGSGLGGKVKAFASGLYAADTLSAFRQRIKDDPPDIVHTHELYPLITPWVFKLCQEESIPVVHAVYDFRITCPVATHFDGNDVCTRCLDGTSASIALQNCRDSMPESMAFGMRHAIARHQDFYQRFVDHFIVCTEFSRDWLVSRAGIERHRVAVNGCVVNASADPVDASRNTKIGFAGRPVTEKGLDVLIAAAESLDMKVAASFPDVPVGGFVDHPRLDTQVTSDREWIREFFRSCRVLVVPSLWFETFCLVAVEAQAEGVPVIASRIGALQDTVIDQSTGFHFEPGNWAELASLIDRMMSDDGLVRRLGGSAHARVQRDFSEDAHFDRLIASYEAVLDGRKCRRLVS